MVDKFVYLGSLIPKDGGCSEKIKRRIAIARSATTKLIKIRPNHYKNSERIAGQFSDFPRSDQKMKQILKVSCVEHRTKVSVLQEIKIKNVYQTKSFEHISATLVT